MPITMPFRVVAFILAFVVLCSGFAAPEQARADSTHNLEQAQELTLGDGRHHPDGSIDPDRADDLPAQPQAEGAHDPLLLEPPGPAVDRTLTLARPYRLGLAALSPPFLEAPERPPCSAAISA
jgi:hypothetical protein